MYLLQEMYIDCTEEPLPDSLKEITYTNGILADEIFRGTEEYHKRITLRACRHYNEIVIRDSSSVTGSRTIIQHARHPETILSLSRAMSPIYVYNITTIPDVREYVVVRLYLDVDKLYDVLRRGDAIPSRLYLFQCLDETYRMPDEKRLALNYELDKLFRGATPAPGDNTTLEFGHNSSQIQLFNFQKRKVAWMSKLENEIVSGGGFIELSEPTIERIINLSPTVVADLEKRRFVRSEDCVAKTSIRKLRGGCILDEPGLGKTASIISRCLQDRTTSKSPVAGTLIICPSETCHNWKAEIKRFDPSAVAVVITNKKSFTLMAKLMLSANYVIISESYTKWDKSGRFFEDWGAIHPRHIGELDESYCSIISEQSFVEGGNLHANLPFHAHHWRRTIVDEAQRLHLPTETHCFVKNLKTDFIWLVTGTPVEDIATHLQLVLFFDMINVVVEIEEFEPPYRAESIQQIRNRICTRDTKETVRDEIEIPTPTEQIIWLDLNNDERVAYNIKLKYNIDDDESLMALCLNPTEPIDVRTVSSKQEAISMLQAEYKESESILTQYADDLRSRFQEEGSMQSDEINSKLEDTVDQLEDTRRLSLYLSDLNKTTTETFAPICSICICNIDSTNTELCMTPCGHIFCWVCAVAWAVQGNTCAECRANTRQGSLVRIKPPSTGTAGETQKLLDNITTLGTKMAHFIDVIERHRNEKIIVFLRTEASLRRVHGVLNDLHIRHVRCYGTETERCRAISSFTNPESSCNVFLLSPDHMCLGVSLTGCTTVVFLENYYDSIDVKNSLEQMVLAHVQHISQKNSIQVIRLILHDTVEEENYENLLRPQNEVIPVEDEEMYVDEID